MPHSIIIIVMTQIINFKWDNQRRCTLIHKCLQPARRPGSTLNMQSATSYSEMARSVHKEDLRPLLKTIFTPQNLHRLCWNFKGWISTGYQGYSAKKKATGLWLWTCTMSSQKNRDIVFCIFAFLAALFSFCIFVCMYASSGNQYFSGSRRFVEPFCSICQVP